MAVLGQQLGHACLDHGLAHDRLGEGLRNVSLVTLVKDRLPWIWHENQEDTCCLAFPFMPKTDQLQSFETTKDNLCG